jgi:hypothetical protein
MPAPESLTLPAEPPACPYDNRIPGKKHPAGTNSLTCPVHRERHRWYTAVRAYRIAAGLHQPRPGRGNRPNPKLRTHVPKCGQSHTYDERLRCENCKKRNAYVAALRRDETAAGYTLNRMIDAAPARQHVTEVLVPSGLRLCDIAERSGVGYHLVSNLVRGVSNLINAINADAILSVRPADRPIAPQGMVDAIAVRRILQGLSAQGWTAAYMGELEGCSFSNINYHMQGRPNGNHRGLFVKVEVLEMARRLADKLGPFDISDLETPLDGMSKRVAARAVRNGWHVLSDWDGLDITDPAATPFDATSPLPFDAPAVGFALAFEPIRAFDDNGNEHVYAAPFTDQLTRAEAYEVVRRGSRPGRGGEPRLSARILAERLQLEERMIQRMRATNRDIDAFLAGPPPLAVALHLAGIVLTDTAFEPHIKLHLARTTLGRYPLSFGFANRLTILRLTQPQPYGLAWTDEQVADWLGCSATDATALRQRAEVAGGQDFAPPAHRVGVPAPADNSERRNAA